MWVRDFLASREDVATDVSVLEKDFTAGPDSGMVVVSLRNASTMTYIQAIVRDGLPQWLVTFEARHESFDLDGPGVARLSHDLGTLAEMCDYLQARTDAAMSAKAAAVAPV
ncbi:protein-L-isoaspartate carboxylmethyltransferase [Microbacterium sp. NPDC019599]|uniref:protein-L-isoaspartate carboxylmethyltransferase n=1 Tax=Microbacterium sp. NPDC019599 TaxID=3154690 RepID=UPI003400F6C1